MTSLHDGRWHPGLGDPHVTGWLTVAAYVVVTLLCYQCHVLARNAPERKFWLVTAMVMAAFGINKQLDLQSWFTEIGRDMALAYGWYQHRRLVQLLFVLILVLGAFRLRAWLSVRLLQLHGHVRLAGAGLVMLAVFVVVRAASFHHIDVLLGMSLASLRINVMLELGAIFVVAWAAAKRLRKSSS